MTEPSEDNPEIMKALHSLSPQAIDLSLNYSEMSVLLLTIHRARYTIQHNITKAASAGPGKVQVPMEVIEYDQFLSRLGAQLCVRGISYLINEVNTNGTVVINQSSTPVELHFTEHPRISWFLAIGLLDNLLDRADTLTENPYADHWRSDLETLRDISLGLSSVILMPSVFRNPILTKAWQSRRDAWLQRLKLDGLYSHGSTETR